VELLDGLFQLIRQVVSAGEFHAGVELLDFHLFCAGPL